MRFRSLLIITALASSAIAVPAAPPVDELVLEAGRPVSAFVLQQTDSAATPAPAVPATPEFKGLPNPDSNFIGLALLAADLAKDGRWAPFCFVALFALTFAFRKWVLKLVPGAVGDLLRGKWGGWLLNALLGLSGGFASVLVLGVPLNAGVVFGVLGGAATFTFGAAGFNELLKDFGASRVAAAEVAAKTAAGGVSTLTDAAAEMRKGPPAS
ncbi:MAG: hypothetical protein QM817_10385 [Archangium sp.]